MKTLQEYEAELQALREMNLKLQIELTKALETIVMDYKSSKKEAA